MAWTQIEQALKTSRDQVELVVIDSVDQDHARMGPGSLGPGAKDRWEVGDVVGDEDALLGRRQRENLVVCEPLELAFFIERANIVTALAKRYTDAPP